MSRNSESGYSSDECQTRSPSNHVINKDAKIFAQRYSVEDELMKSANGVLYTGFDLRSGTPVVIKQIPRDVVGEYKIVDGRMIPSEIYYHVKSAELSKFVVKPLDWFEDPVLFSLWKNQKIQSIFSNFTKNMVRSMRTPQKLFGNKLLNVPKICTTVGLSIEISKMKIF